MSHIGLVVHPTRNVDGPVGALRRWAAAHGVTVVEVRNAGQRRPIAATGDAAECDLIVSIGGDGTTLAALRAAATAGKPVLGAACGSLGVLTAVPGSGVGEALERFSAGDWVPRPIPALDIAADGEPPRFALNDVALVREGGGQVRLTASVDGTLFTRLAGDGCVVSTPLGSSAYTLAAGGPLLLPGTDAFVLTPLPAHGGSRAPLVVPSAAIVELEVTGGYGGSRMEIDGQVVATELGRIRIGCRAAAATLVAFADEEPFLTGLRRRKIITDSPRILAEGHREAGKTATGL